MAHQKLLEIDPKLKKKRPELAEVDPDLDEETIERKAEEHRVNEEEKLEKRYEKMCEKAKNEGLDKPDRPVVIEKELSGDRLEKQIATLDKKLKQLENQRIDKVLMIYALITLG